MSFSWCQGREREGSRSLTLSRDAINHCVYFNSDSAVSLIFLRIRRITCLCSRLHYIRCLDHLLRIFLRCPLYFRRQRQQRRRFVISHHISGIGGQSCIPKTTSRGAAEKARMYIRGRQLGNCACGEGKAAATRRD